MARGTITDLETVKAWQIKVDQTNDAALQRCLEAASATIEAVTSRRYGADDYASEMHSGDAAAFYQTTNDVALYTRWWPLISIASITEDGVTIPIVGQNTVTGGDCALIGPEDGMILRATSRGASAGYDLIPWAEGAGNVVVSYRAGYEPDTMPPEIVQVCCELTWLLFTGRSHVGMNNVARAGKAAAFLSKLGDVSREALNTAARAMRPCTALGF